MGHSTLSAGAIHSNSMRLRLKMRAIVALAAAYAVVLQATLLAIGPLTGPAGLAAGFLCAQQHGAPANLPPGRNDPGCAAACLACCCGLSAPPASPPMLAARSALPRRIASAPAVNSGAPLRVARAHRSRAPPVG
jgi:hypothetical protein